MIKIFFMLMGLISLNVHSNDVLYDDERFSLLDFNNKECHLLKIKNKMTNRILVLTSTFIDSIDLSQNNCFTSENNESIKIKFYPSDSHDLNNGYLLRLNYDLNSKILVDNVYKHISSSRCTIIDLEKSKIVGDSNAREHICTEDDFYIYLRDYPR